MANNQNIDFNKLPKFLRILGNVGVVSFLLVILCLLISIWYQHPVIVKVALTSALTFIISIRLVRLETRENDEVKPEYRKDEE